MQQQQQQQRRQRRQPQQQQQQDLQNLTKLYTVFPSDQPPPSSTKRVIDVEFRLKAGTPSLSDLFPPQRGSSNSIRSKPRTANASWRWRFHGMLEAGVTPVGNLGKNVVPTAKRCVFQIRWW